MQGHAVVGRWLETQNQRRFSDYVALYAADFQGVKKTAKGVETSLNLQQWKADREKMFRRPNLTVEIFAEQYAVEPTGEISVAFTQVFRSGSYSDQGRKAMLLKQRDGEWKIVKEQLIDAGAVEAGAIVTASAGENVATAFPKSFADELRLDVFPCNKKNVCDATLTIGRDKQKRVVLGKLESDAEGESTGLMHYRVRSFQYVPFGPLNGTVLAVVDTIDRDDSSRLEGRIATILGRAPAYASMWSGEIAASQAKTITGCRLAVVPDQAREVWDVVRTCGDKQLIARLQ
jgi:hypothetical protein